MLNDPLFYAAAIPAVLIVGISKGGFGGGLGLVAVPMIALVASPQYAAALMLPILCLMDIVGLIRFRTHFVWDTLKVLLPAAAIGIVLGALSFRYMNDAQIKLMIGCIAILFVTHHLLRKKGEPRQPSIIRGSFWGTLAGFTSFGVHAGGPPLNIYLLPLKLDKTTYTATTVVFFATINFIKLIPYTWLGQFNQQTLLTALLLSPLAPIGVLIGAWLHHKINDRWFYIFCYGFVALAGIKLVYDALNTLL